MKIWSSLLSTRGLVFLILLLIILPLGLGDNQPGLAAGQSAMFFPNISVNPGNGMAGASVTISGSDYTAGTEARVRWDGVDQNSFNMPAQPFSINWTIPYGVSPGTHQIGVCTGCGQGEFEQFSQVPFNVIAPSRTPTIRPSRTATTIPSNTPTTVPSRTPTITLTPFISFTPTETSIYTSTHTPTLEGCRDSITILHPEHAGDLGGVESTDFIVEVIYYGAEPLTIEFYVREHSTNILYTQWPDPLPGTVVEVETDPSNPNRWVFTVRDIPVPLGPYAFMVQIPRYHTCMPRSDKYTQFRNGFIPSATPRPSVCGDLGLSVEAELINFETGNGLGYYSRWLETQYGLRFEGSLKLLDASGGLGVLPRSGSHVGGSGEGMEFGSAFQPIRMSFDRGLQALGMFVGLDQVYSVTSEITAVLSVYGYRGGGGELTFLGAGTVSFPPEPTDLVYCVKFEAAPGDVIAKAELDYIDAAGTSIAERRLIDDLTLVYFSSVEDPAPGDTGGLPPDLPPVVDITGPSGAEVITAATVAVRANIAEDRGLAHVYYRINDGDLIEIGYSPVVGSPGEYFTGFNLSASLLDYNQTNTFTIVAEDTAGQRGSDSVILTLATPVPDLDIIIYKIEVIQTVQCLESPSCGPDNSIHLYTGKPTLVRAYVYSTGTDDPMPNISGQLCIRSACFPSMNRVTVSPNNDPVRVFRRELASTLNFIIPEFYTARAQSLQLLVTVNPDMRDALECCMGNNTMSQDALIRPSAPINVVTIGVARADGSSPDYVQARAEMLPFFKAVYPTGDVRFLTFAGDALMSLDYDFGSCGQLHLQEGWAGLLYDLLWKANLSGPDPDPMGRRSGGPVYWYGMVDESVGHGPHGCGMYPPYGFLAAGIVNTRWMHYADFAGEILAHEIGHNNGFAHPAGCDAANTNPAAPSFTGSYGVDLRYSGIFLYRPSSYDFMSYCGDDLGTWVSHITYRALGSGLYGVAQNPEWQPSLGMALRPPLQTEADFLVGTVYVTADSADLRRGFYTMTLSPDQQRRMVTYPENGYYLVTLLDENGQVIGERYFDPMRIGDDNSLGDEGLIQVVIPWNPEAAYVVIKRKDTVILSLAVSSMPPSLSLLSPNGGETWPETGVQTIQWEASDNDGDSLRYMLEYSVDGGQTWDLLEVNLSATSYEIEAATLAGSDQARFRVTASDGINTIYDESDANFTVPRKPPQIAILEPIEGAVYDNSLYVMFDSFAQDHEDQWLEDAAYQWTSDLDGSLGEGPSLWGLLLSAGEHTITLSVTDSDGNTSSKSVTITIENETGPVTAAGPKLKTDKVLLWGGLLVVLVVGVGLIAYGVITLRRRRENVR